MLNTDELVRISAAAVVSRLEPGNSAAIQILRRGLESEEVKVAMVACDTFGQLGLKSPEVIRLLIGVLDDVRCDGRLAALNALWNIGATGEPRFESIRSIADDERNREYLRGHALTVLGAITKGKTRAISILLSALVSPAPEIVHGAVCGLVEVGLAEARIVDGLTNLVASENERHSSHRDGRNIETGNRRFD